MSERRTGYTWSRKRQSGLTAAERRVMALVAHGATNEEAAAALGLARQTVRNHVHRIMRKLHLRNRTEIAAVQFGAVPWAWTKRREGR